MKHHPTTKAERKLVKNSLAKKYDFFKESWGVFKHQAEHNLKKLSLTRRQKKAEISEKEQLIN